MEAGKDLHPAFTRDTYLFRRKVFKLVGGAFHVYDENENVLFYSEQKAFKLKEDFRIYSDEQKSQELLVIKTPKILDINATYDVTDGTTGEQVGSLKRKGLKSVVKDEWLLLSRDGRQIGRLTETSVIGAIISRIIDIVPIPQSYSLLSDTEEELVKIKQAFNPFVFKYTMTFVSPDPPIDRRLIMAAGILLLGIEGRQS